MEEIELQLPPDVVYVGLARLVVTTAARQSGMDDARVEDLKIAVSEATTNMILAHQQDDREEPVVLSFAPRGPRFEVTIHDTGLELGQAGGIEAGRPDEGSDTDGLGVTVIRGLTDDVEFVRDTDSRVHMRFAIALEDGSTQAG